ncbi:MAG: putative DNA binding domain-containing protein, partial [Victivallaceae bacterium]|nr:putative DNA binding domain-containing protein [Victivallaceae bacterium]
MSAEYDWKSIIYRGVESDELDYKAALDWSKLNRGGRAKFARHCLAMANTKGGFVVVGVGEDDAGQPTLFTGLTEAQLKSFDPTNVGKPSQVARTQSSMKEEVISKKPRFARPPAA